MATYKTIRGSAVSPKDSYHICDICGSSDIVENSEGYVCRVCGIVLEIQKLQYNRPYNDDIIQYAMGLGKTQIGTEQEREFSPQFKQLKRLNGCNLQTEYEQEILQKAKREISRICANLKLEGYDNLKEMIFLKFKKVWPELKPGGKYKNVEKLILIITFFCLKIRNISIRVSRIIKKSALTKRDFNDFYQQIERFFPEYKNRNRQEYIIQLILELSWHFNLGTAFNFQTKKIFYKLWDGIKDTTDSVIAGVVSSISVLCSKTFRDKVRISHLCEHLNIRMSSVQNQVEKKIIERFNVKDFVSLVKSSGILENIFTKLGLVETPEVKVENLEKVELVLGNASEIFNRHDDIDYYFLAMSSKCGGSTIIYIGIHHPLMNFVELVLSNKQNNKFLEFEIVKYFKGKGPP